MGNEIMKRDESINLPSIDIQSENELQIASSGALAIQEIQAAIVVAKRFPRNFDDVWSKVMKSCKRKSLAEKAAYSYPRGGSQISGPSVYLARVIAGQYGNLRFGVDILRDDEGSRLIRGWCWDVENNSKVHFDDDFKKLVYRKKEGWIVPDERDLRELTNKRGAILMRNAIYNIIPRDLIEDALAQSALTLRSEIRDPDGEKKHLILELDKIGVTVPMVNTYLGHTVWDTDDIVELKGILNAIKDGTTKRDDYFGSKAEPERGTLDINAMKAGDPATHRAHPEPPKKIQPEPAQETATEIAPQSAESTPNAPVEAEDEPPFNLEAAKKAANDIAFEAYSKGKVSTPNYNAVLNMIDMAKTPEDITNAGKALETAMKAMAEASKPAPKRK